MLHMKIYEASKELIDILISNGFVEDTDRTYPEHAKRLIDSEYNPHGMKRHLSYVGTREKVYLDYINIKLPTGVQCYGLSLEDLKSLITFCRLSASDRSILVGQRYNVLSIPEIISNIEREPRIYSKSVYSRAENIFKNLNHIG